MQEHDIGTFKIIDYEAKYKNDFKRLNEEWISTYFKMEAADYIALDHPDEYIINKGGHILVAICNQEPVGVCALIKMQDDIYDFELAKMGVSPKFQGQKIGLTLGLAIIDKAKSLDARNIYLESNTILESAINLYRKLGFKEVTGRLSPYERANIKMLLDLT